MSINNELPKFSITYKGKTLNTIRWVPVSDKQRLELKTQYYAKPTKSELAKEIQQLYNGGTQNSKVTKYFVWDLMTKTQLYTCLWTIDDVFESNDLLGYFIAFVQAHPNTFNTHTALIDNIATAIRIGGKPVAGKPTNFPLQAVDFILSKYNINNKWYDFSCGWGARLTGALRNQVEYYGTDPNYLLCPRLEQLAATYKYMTSQPNLKSQIYCQGSEVFISELENTIGLAFSSPPYFYLEDYKIGNQSYKEGTSYEDWLNLYMKPTIQNIYKYLINNGIFAMNIKSFEKFDLVNDIKQISINCGFIYRKSEILKNIQRLNENKELVNSDEEIMIFTKSSYNGPLTFNDTPTKQTMNRHKLF